MTIILEPYTIPDKGQVELKIDRSFEIRVGAEEARRKVNRWLHQEVSFSMRGLAPTLVIGERVVWRVPAWLGMPHLGQVGPVGSVEVDVTTGEMNNTPERKAEIERQAGELVKQLPPYRPHGEVPAEYIPRHIPPAPKLHLHEDGTMRVLPADQE